jgi:hypothetical protein
VEGSRVEEAEGELENGDVLRNNAQLRDEMTPDEFQEHYDRACNLIHSLQAAGGDCSQSPKMVRRGKAEDHSD